MKITKEHRIKIEEIIKSIECPKDFKCYKSDFEDLANIKIFHDGELVECLDERSHLCKFNFIFGRGCYCKCPFRRYIAQNFNR